MREPKRVVWLGVEMVERKAGELAVLWAARKESEKVEKKAAESVALWAAERAVEKVAERELRWAGCLGDELVSWRGVTRDAGRAALLAGGTAGVLVGLLAAEMVAVLVVLRVVLRVGLKVALLDLLALRKEELKASKVCE